VTARYEEVLLDLRRAYDAKVDERRAKPLEPWKQAEREAFLARLRDVGAVRLLEVGAGTGLHGRFFADEGLEVVSTDASPAMVEACRSIGLTAHECDFLSLVPSADFDAVWAMNCVLHVPPHDLVPVLRAIHGTLRRGGLLFLGQYGGVSRAGELDDDGYEPKRFFSSVTDETLLDAAAQASFAVVDFHAVDFGGNDGTHFQSLTATAEEG
jgi:SAM-dependent methyltransferase